MSPRNKIVAGRRSPNLVRCRSGGGRLVAILVVTLMIAPFLTGCAYHRQVQYFAATDPETGATNYYRMTITGSGGGGTDYHLQAGYFSSAAIDVLRGSMPDVPILDLPVEQLEVFDRLTTHFYAALIQEAKRISNVSDPEAILIAARSTRSTAERRVGRLTTDLNRFQRDVAREQGKLAELKSERDDDDRAFQAEDTAVTESRKTHRELKRTLATQETARKKAEKHLKDVQNELSEILPTAAADSSSGNGTTPSEPPEVQAARQAVVDAQSSVDTAEEAVTETKKALRDSETEQSEAGANLAQAEGRLRDSQAAAAASQRTVDRLLGKVDSQQVEIDRSAAARDAANKMLELLNEKLEDDPFSPLAGDADIKPFKDPEIIELARVIWYGSLSTSDLASIGMTGNTDPFQFRKLVFWTTANNINLNDFATEIDSVIDSAVSIAQTARTQAKQRKAARKSRKDSMGTMIDAFIKDPAQADGLRSMMEMMAPSAPDPLALLGGIGEKP